MQNDPSVAFVGRNDGFVLANARVSVSGTYRDRVAFRLSADGAEDEREGANATRGVLRFALKDAYADFRFSRAAIVRAGQFHTLHDTEELTPRDERAFVDAALESRGVRPTEGWETPGLGVDRGLGLALRAPRAVGGDALALGYEISVQNGSGENQSANDNDALAWGAALALSFPGDSMIAVGARHNRRSEGDLPFRQTEEDVQANAMAMLGMGPVRAGGQVLARRTTFPTTGGPVENAIGAHAQVLARVGRFEPGYRYAILDPSDLVSVDLVQEHTLGMNVYLDEWRAKIQLNVTHAIEQAGRELDNSRGEILLQVSL